MREWAVVEAYRRDHLRRADACFKVGAVSYGKTLEAEAKTLFRRWEAGQLIVSKIAADLDMIRAASGRDSLPLPALPFNAPDSDIRAAASDCAQTCDSRIAELQLLDAAWDACAAICERMQVQPARPKLDEHDKPIYGPALARMACPRWWRRRLRVMVTRRVETLAVTTGRVHVGGQVYCSDRCLRRRRASAQRNAEILQRMQAVNELGEVFSLAELAELGVSNPVLRRAELMTRIKGLEQIAAGRGERGLFLTWTLPSRFHAVLSKSGRQNPKYDGSTPADGQAELVKQWALVRASLANRGVKLYGMRVVEPHHDGTPHWHLLLWFPRKDERLVCATIAQYAFREGDEPGARDSRMKFEPILKSKGGAVSYLAKYLAKNVDGFQLEMTMTRDDRGDLMLSDKDPRTAAERIRAWASCWAIRQFQFIGDAPVTLWREARRLGDEQSSVESIERVRAAADAADYGEYVRAAGGVLVRRCDRPVFLLRQCDLPGSVGSPGRYGDQSVSPIRGIAAADGSGIELTRRHEWTILSGAKGADTAPWTRVNNCNQMTPEREGGMPAAPAQPTAARASPPGLGL